MNHRTSRRRRSLRKNSRRTPAVALDRAEDAYDRAVQDAEERGADPETDWACTQRRGAVMEARLRHREHHKGLRRNSHPTRRMSFGEWYKAAGSPRVESSQAEYALMRLRDDWAAGVDPQKYRGMRANSSWQGIDSLERRENLIHNRLAGVILGEVTRARADEYIHEAQAFVDNLDTQHPPGGARGRAGKWKANTLSKLRGYLVRARKQLGMAANRRTSRRLGSGKRFASLTRSLRARGSRNPRALAAWIGRRKYGSKRFAKLASAGRRRSLRKNSRRRGSLRRNSGKMKYRAWISGASGNAKVFTATGAWEALTIAEQRAASWWPSERGEYVHLMARRNDGSGRVVERTILVGEQR